MDESTNITFNTDSISDTTTNQLELETKKLSKLMSDALTQLKVNRESKLEELKNVIQSKLFIVNPPPEQDILQETQSPLSSILPEARKVAEAVSALESSSPMIQRGGEFSDEFSEEFSDEY